MPSVNYRGWTPIESDPRWDTDGYYESVSARADGLAKFWSEVHHEAEQRQFTRQSEYEDRYDYADDYEVEPQARDYALGESDPAYLSDLEDWNKADEDSRTQAGEYERERIAADEMHRAKMEFCESQLAALGARIMRPYEHWNEDEKFMEWSERDRD